MLVDGQVNRLRSRPVAASQTTSVVAPVFPRTGAAASDASADSPTCIGDSIASGPGSVKRVRVLPVLMSTRDRSSGFFPSPSVATSWTGVPSGRKATGPPRRWPGRAAAGMCWRVAWRRSEYVWRPWAWGRRRRRSASRPLRSKASASAPKSLICLSISDVQPEQVGDGLRLEGPIDVPVASPRPGGFLDLPPNLVRPAHFMR